MKKRGVFITLILLICIVSLVACNSAAEKQYYVFGGISLEIKIKGENAKTLADDVAAYIDSLEPIFSPTVPNSDLNRINNAPVGEGVSCSDAAMDLIRCAEYVYNESGGAYDPSIYPLVRLWKFSGDAFLFQGAKIDPPTADEIADAISKTGLSRAFSIDYENNTVTKLIEGAMLDFGGSAKGYAVDKARQLLDAQETLISLGGNISALNASYSIGISNPRNSGTPFFGSFKLLSGQCVTTSGDYERYYVSKADERVIYHHILNPFTGYPSDNTSSEGLISVSVISEDGALGDAVSTAVMVLGKTRGIQLLEKLGLSAVLISPDMSYTVAGTLDFVKK